MNLAYRWFCRLDLSDPVPNHSTFSKNRHGRFRESELLRHLFEITVARCIADGLVSGQRMAIDVSLIEADANKQNSTPKEDWDTSRIDPSDAPCAVREYLDTLDDAAFGAVSEVEPKFMSHFDPASQWTGAHIVRSISVETGRVPAVKESHNSQSGNPESEKAETRSKMSAAGR